VSRENQKSLRFNFSMRIAQYQKPSAFDPLQKLCGDSIYSTTNAVKKLVAKNEPEGVRSAQIAPLF
jgi:hypothetical protein